MYKTDYDSIFYKYNEISYIIGNVIVITLHI